MLLWVSLALGIRLGLLLYGEWQDNTMAVKYTDVDYFVFSDAASYVLKGESPYNRSTYRYTPLLAWMIVPNFYLGKAFGKILFILFDVAGGLLIYSILTKRGHNSDICRFCALTWLLNPLPAAVSSRGNAESIMACLILFTLKCLQSNCRKTMAVCYALSVHFKIYPVTYSLPIYFLLGTGKSISAGKDNRRSPAQQIMNLFFPNKERLSFVVIFTIVLLVLTSGFYYVYGWDFLEHSYLYHIKRRDIRHNFSVYFYLLYLIDEQPWLRFINLAVFLPQCVLLFLVSLRFYRDPPFCWFLHTFIFVTFNKVCTSQYFLWYLCLLPVVLPQLRMPRSKGITLIVLWFLGQGLWLWPAYCLEFEGKNTFLLIWLAGILFFCVNVYIVNTIINAYCPKDFLDASQKSLIKKGQFIRSQKKLR